MKLNIKVRSYCDCNKAGDIILVAILCAEVSLLNAVYPQSFTYTKTARSQSISFLRQNWNVVAQRLRSQSRPVSVIPVGLTPCGVT